MRNYTFNTSCVACGDGQAIKDMMDMAIPISLRTFAKYVDTCQLIQDFGYDHRRGCILSKDWHVAYYRSQWQGKRCYVFVHSAIEYIYTKS